MSHDIHDTPPPAQTPGSESDRSGKHGPDDARAKSEAVLPASSAEARESAGAYEGKSGQVATETAGEHGVGTAAPAVPSILADPGRDPGDMPDFLRADRRPAEWRTGG